jgi:hypothetical protein
MHQPLQDLVLAGHIGGQKASGLAGKVEQDGATLEQRNRLAARAVRVDQGGDLVVGTEGEELGRELLARADVHGMHPVRKAALLQHDVDLVPVGRGP